VLSVLGKAACCDSGGLVTAAHVYQSREDDNRCSMHQDSFKRCNGFRRKSEDCGNSFDAWTFVGLARVTATAACAGFEGKSFLALRLSVSGRSTARFVVVFFSPDGRKFRASNAVVIAEAK